MRLLKWVLPALTMVLGANLAMAQGGPGAGKGPGVGPQGAGPMAGASAPAPGMRAGRSPGARFGADYTPGWSLMTVPERNEHRDRMRAMKSYEECKAYQAQHHEQMAARAKEKGGKALLQPRRDACAGLKP